MSIMPALLIGLDTTGHQVLQDITHFLPQAYGAERLPGVALLGMAFERLDPPEGGYHQTIDADLTTWLASPKRFDQLGSVPDWFDVSTYVTARVRYDKPDITEPQIARLMFVKSFHNAPDGMLRPLARAIAALRSYHGRQAITPLTVHVLANLDDPLPAACLLDVVNLVYYAGQQDDVNMQIVLHLAMPEVADQPPKRESVQTMARAYAALQELGRFMATYEDVRHQVYPEDSPLARYAVDDMYPVHSVKVYPPMAADDIIAQWADFLLPLLDGASTHFGRRYEQYHLKNWHAWRDAALRETERYAFIAGTCATASAIFPQRYLEEALAQQAARRVMDTFLGQSLSSRQQQRGYYQTHWLQQAYTVNGESLICPPVMAGLLDIPDALDLGGWTANDWLNMLEVSRLPGSARRALTWQATSILTDTDKDTYFQQMDAAIERLIGSLTVTQIPDNVEPDYVAAWQTVLNTQYQMIEASFRAFSQVHLHRTEAGLRTLHDVLNGALSTGVRRAERVLQAVIRDSEREFAIEALPEQLQRARYQVEKLRNFFGRETSDVKRFQATVQRLVERMQIYHARQQMYRFVQRVKALIMETARNLENWYTYLAVGDESLLNTLKAPGEKALHLPESTSRFWLYDDALFDELLSNLDATLPDLAGRLVWRTSGTKAGDWHLVCLSTDRVETQHLFNPAYVQQDSAAWETVIHDEVAAQVAPRLWEHYLSAGANRTDAVTRIAEFMYPESRLNEQLMPYREDHILLMPLGLTGSSDVLEALKDRAVAYNYPLPDVRPGLDATRLTRYRFQEAFTLSNMPAYAHLQAAYRQQSVILRSRLHVLIPEVQVLRMNSYTHGHLDATASHGVISLLERRDRLEWFVRLHAAGVITSLPYEVTSNAYGLLDAEGEFVWWLSPPASDASLITAVMRFQYTRDELPFGRRDALPQGKRPLPVADFAILLSNAIEKRSATKRPGDYPRDVQNLLRKFQRYQTAEVAQNARQRIEQQLMLEDYQREMHQTASRYGQQSNDDERIDLCRLLAALASQEAAQIQDALLKRLA